MSILSQQAQQTPSKEEKLAQKVKRIKEFSKQSYNQINFLQKEGIKLLWKDSSLTPQEIIDALGADALKVFQMHGILTTAIVDIATVDGITPSIALPTNAFSTLSGTIVVSEDPYTI
jgi:hypothetical protein